MGLIRNGSMAVLLATGPLLQAQVASELPSIGQEQVVLEGTVVDSEGHGIPMARLTLASTNIPAGQTAFSGDDARFFFYRLKPGSYTLTVSATGFDDSSRSVDMRYGSQRIRIVLQRREAPEAPAGKAVVSAKDLKVSAKAQHFYDEGQKLLGEKKPKEALKAFRNAIEDEPNFPSAYSGMGITYIQIKDFDRAAEAFEKALSMQDSLGEAHLGLGLVANERKAYPDAEKHLVRARELLPGDWRVYYELGRSLYNQARLREAESSLVQGRELHPDYGNLRILLANTYAREDKLPEALAEMQAFLKVAPKSPLAPKVRKTVKAIEAEIEHRQ